MCRAIGVALQAVTFVYIARVLPISEMGYFGVAFAFLGIVRFLGPIGADQVAMRELAHETDRSSAKAQQISAASLAFVSLSGVIIAIATGVVLALASRSRTDGWQEVAAIVLSVPAFALIGLLAGQTRGCGHNLAAQLPEAVALHAIFGLCVITLVWLGSVNRATLLVGLCISGWGVVIISAIIRLRIGLHLTSVPSVYAVIRVGRDGFGIAQALSFTALSARAPIFMAAALVGPAAAAMLDFAARFGTVPSLISTSIGATFSPQFALLAHKEDRPALVRALRLSSSIGGTVAALYLAALLVAARFAINALLPSTYALSYAPMLLMCAAATVNAALGPASILLLMSGQEGKVTAFSAAQLLTLAVGSATLAGAFGTIGIACSVVLGALVRDGGLMLVTLRGGLLSKSACRVATGPLTT